MGYKSLAACVADLEKHGHLVRIKAEMDPNLEMAEIQRRLYEAQGPAVLFENVNGSPFPAVTNLFGTLERSRFMFRDTLKKVQKVMEVKANPPAALKNPFKYIGLPFFALNALPAKARFSKPVMYGKTTISQLPQIKSWPMDGGPFITLPQVFTEDPDHPGPMKSNMGMYRIQLGGNRYQQDAQIGMHYQIHRGIGVHHHKALAKGEPLRVSIFVGGPPSHTFGAVMPLPEGLSELLFAGMLGGRRFRWTRDQQGHFLSTMADFCITGTVEPNTLPEGPFGDHLGYYSLAHEFPVLKVDSVYHRKDAIWPFTVVGRPPQEDTSFGALIHEITEPVVSTEIPGLHAMHAVDAAGVHPLMIAIGSERYVPYGERKPQELLTISNALLGFGQASLAKYLMIAAKEDDPGLNLHHIDHFFKHVLERFDPQTDLHFQTRTTMDTLDYSGTGINSGSKLVIAAAGSKKRTLSDRIPEGLRLPTDFHTPSIALPGILAISGPKYTHQPAADREVPAFCQALEGQPGLEGFPLIILCDDAAFTAEKLNNFLWVTFTRSNPSHDVYGVGSFMEYKHWGCTGPIVIDARIKPHHAPPLIEDPAITKRVDALAAKGGPLHGLI